MNKTIKKTVNSLKRFIAHTIIRTRETEIVGDFSYTDIPLILRGFSAKGEMIVQYANQTFERKVFGSTEHTLPIYFTDHNWKLYSRIKRVSDSELSKWIGKKVRRTVPTKNFGDRSFMDKPVTLVAASKYHLIIKREDSLWGTTDLYTLRYEYADPREWELAE